MGDNPFPKQDADSPGDPSIVRLPNVGAFKVTSNSPSLEVTDDAISSPSTAVPNKQMEKFLAQKSSKKRVAFMLVCDGTPGHSRGHSKCGQHGKNGASGNNASNPGQDGAPGGPGGAGGPGENGQHGEDGKDGKSLTLTISGVPPVLNVQSHVWSGQVNLEKGENPIVLVQSRGGKGGDGGRGGNGGDGGKGGGAGRGAQGRGGGPNQNGSNGGRGGDGGNGGGGGDGRGGWCSHRYIII
eukprot:TRINITY_DN2489_c3_g1_i2.p1 TRINITY_DN2489_c3_g1~~TRINITY_DN2489_c3_g1_i2.p1  ORF type:complete len:265 (-),score=75.52 TRINITY_DN2489_c3_g1_i2:128-847(-)